ncbi:MAG: hypothetical protein ACW98X_14565 [Promethearchaeota archaeon]|jgi:hypothetical protein
MSDTGSLSELVKKIFNDKLGQQLIDELKKTTDYTMAMNNLLDIIKGNLNESELNQIGDLFRREAISKFGRPPTPEG